MAVIDYSWWRPTIAELKAAGVTTVCRYLGYPGIGVGKVIGPAEYAALRTAGIGVILNWETSGRSWRGAYAAGVREGTEARRQARQLGYPDAWPIIQSIDEGVPATMIGIADQYQRGFNDGGKCGPQGAYGTKFALDSFFGLGLITVGWQTNARGWFANRDDCARALLFQRVTHPLSPPLPANQYDYNDVNSAALASSPYPFLSAGPKPPTVPPKPPKPETGGRVVAIKEATTKLVTADHDLGFGQWGAILETGRPVVDVQGTVHGPCPHGLDDSSKDDLWPWSIGATVRVQARGTKAVVTVAAPNWKPGQPHIQVHVTAFH